MQPTSVSVFGRASTGGSGIRNPYVGPRPFNEDDYELFGRDDAARELIALIKTERLVVLHSPSGAGKTSLLQNVIAPRMRKAGYDVLPILRVGLTPPDMLEPDPPHPNRYLRSALLSLDQVHPDWAVQRARTIRPGVLRDALEELRDLRPRAETQLLIFDQFEEIASLDPTDELAKRCFFTELGSALRHSRCAIVLSVREEFLGDIEPFLETLVTSPVRTYRLELLRHENAVEAIERPADIEGVAFAADALGLLLENLLQTKVRGPGGALVIRPGVFVEPVQLQVVCHSLWERKFSTGEHLEDSPSITAKDVEAFGDLDSVLADYFDKHVALVASETGVDESSIRDWIEHQLVAEGGVRNQVLQGEDRTRGLPNSVLQRLEDARLIRAERRRGFVWYEITHDRLVLPITDSNRSWEERHVPALRKRVREWVAARKPDSLLLSLREFLREVGWGALIRYQTRSIHDRWADAEVDFVKRSRERVRGIFIGLIVILILVVFAVDRYYRAQRYYRESTFSRATYWQLSSEILDLQKELQARSYGEVPRQIVAMDTLSDLPDIHGHPRSIPEPPVSFGLKEQAAERRRAGQSLDSLRARLTGTDATVLRTPQTLAGSIQEDFRRWGFNLVPAPMAQTNQPNSLMFGDSVPIEQAKAVALRLLASGTGVRRVRRFDPAGTQPHTIVLIYEERVHDWAPLTVSQIDRLLVP